MRLLRAVRLAELADIRTIGEFRNPVGIEVKYFVLTASEAERFARMAMSSFEDGPYYLIEAEISDDLITPEMKVMVDGGIVAYILPDVILQNISEIVLTRKI